MINYHQQSIAKGSYMAISSTTVTPPRWFLIAFIMRGDILSRILGQVVLHQKLKFFFSTNKLHSRNFDLFVHETVVKPYNLLPTTFKISSNISEPLFNVHRNFVILSSLDFNNVTSSSKLEMVEPSFSFSLRRACVVFFFLCYLKQDSFHSEKLFICFS